MEKTESSKFEFQAYGILKHLKKGRFIAWSFVVLFIALGAWFQFSGTEMAILSNLKSNILSLVGSAQNESVMSSGGKLSTTGGIDVLWEQRKSVAGESIWSVYAKMTAGDSAIILKNQTVNGLKNLTLLKNSIAIDRIAAHSLTDGKEYSFLSSVAVSKYAGELAEANKQISGGTALKDLSKNLQTAYLVANAPSYEFLYSLPADTLQALY
ncbi:hypothetical protein HY250_04655 [Candidatus Azambacteria bacterium]|nr:hypothetical protein [Candidatus Azambacteria bacterium]MBI3685669.1 hypothetical protein [Candidatus Azambacteria bacterium]